MQNTVVFGALLLGKKRKVKVLEKKRQPQKCLKKCIFLAPPAASMFSRVKRILNEGEIIKMYNIYPSIVYI